MFLITCFFLNALHTFNILNIALFYLSLSSTELWLSLEEHQYALELIMGRYRKQMLQLMMEKKEMDTKPMLSLHEDHAKVHVFKSLIKRMIF